MLACIHPEVISAVFSVALRLFLKTFWQMDFHAELCTSLLTAKSGRAVYPARTSALCSCSHKLCNELLSTRLFLPTNLDL